jgi:hypothetical protein
LLRWPALFGSDRFADHRSQNQKLGTVWLPTFLTIPPISIVGRHEAGRIFGIPGAGHFISAGQALGLYYIRRTGSSLFSRKCRLPTKSSAVRARPQPGTGDLLVDQLRAYHTFYLVLHNHQWTISDVAVAGICVGGPRLHCNGNTGGSRRGHHRLRTLPLARSNSRYRRSLDRSRHRLSLEYNPRKTASYLGAANIGRERGY